MTWLSDKDFARYQGNTGVNHNLPRNATSVDYLFLFFYNIFAEIRL